MRRPRPTRRLLTAFALVVVVVVGVWAVYPRRAEVGGALRTLEPVELLLSAAATVVGVALTAEVWRSWLKALGSDLPVLTAHRVFYLTQSAKYLPGGLWPLAAQAAVSRRFGVPVGAMVTASSLFMLTHVVSGAAVGLALLGSTSNEYVAASAQVVALAGLLALTPPGVRLLVGLARRLRVPVSVPTPTWGATARALGLMLGAWLCYGVALVLVARGAGAPEVGLLLGTGAFASGWTVGFLALAVPAGVGVRESVVVGALLGTGTAEGTALVVAVVSRALFTLVDIGLALASVGVVGRLAERPAAGAAGEGTPTQGPAAGRAAHEDGSPAEDLRGA